MWLLLEMAEEHNDDLHKNQFFSLLDSSGLLKLATEKSLIVCVPNASSMSLSRLDKDFVHSHVLQRTATKDEYKTLNGKTVLFKGVFATLALHG